MSRPLAPRWNCRDIAAVFEGLDWPVNAARLGAAVTPAASTASW
jgi:hypothetical protein